MAHEQKSMFQYVEKIDNHDGGVVQFFKGAPMLEPNGKLIFDTNVKLDDDLKQWVNDIASAADIPVSKLIRSAIIFFKIFYKIHRKMLFYRKAVFGNIENLP